MLKSMHLGIQNSDELVVRAQSSIKDCFYRISQNIVKEQLYTKENTLIDR